MNNSCRICGGKNNVEEYTIKEMMFGTRENFLYFKCSNCGCLQIKEFPKNLKDYYPATYLPEPGYIWIKKYLRKKREVSAFSGKGVLGRMLIYLFGYPFEHLWFTEASIIKTDSILEVGCGKGNLLKLLNEAGFGNLLGIDPFIEDNINYNRGLKILKGDLAQINGSFDCIMFHHSFEHLPNPHETLALVKKLVNISGKVLIRIPLIDCYAWERYKTNWVQLDAPRHFFLYTVKSIKYLADAYGFKIKKIVYDSDSFQFWGSEQYERQIPLMSNNSLFVKCKNSIFSKEEMIQFENKARELNRKNQGDRASFYLEL